MLRRVRSRFQTTQRIHTAGNDVRKPGISQEPQISLSQYTYDTLDNITGVTQNAQSGTPQSRSFAYDGFGRLTSESNPETGTSSYVYDSNTVGDLYTKHDASGVIITYTHGAFHRLLTANVGSSFCRNFLYDLANAHSGANYANGRIAKAYTTNCGSDVLPAFRTSPSMISDEGKGNKHVGEQA